MKRIRSPVILALTLAAGGCVSTDPIVAWQGKVGDYVQTAGGGDPSVLRLIPGRHSFHDLTPARITISKLGLPGPGFPGLRKERDIIGLLVDTVVIDSHRWYAFLVGVLRRNPGPAYRNEEALSLESIRLSDSPANRTRPAFRGTRRSAECIRQPHRAGSFPSPTIVLKPPIRTQGSW